MKKNHFLLLIALFVAFMVTACSHAISIEQAANGGKAKCGRNHLK